MLDISLSFSQTLNEPKLSKSNTETGPRLRRVCQNIPSTTLVCSVSKISAVSVVNFLHSISLKNQHTVIMATQRFSELQHNGIMLQNMSIMPALFA